MTRVNLVPPSEMDKPRLTGEYHEIPRIFGLVRKRIAKGQSALDVKLEQPRGFCLGTGHQLFFYTRLGFICKRITALVEEMLDRGYNVDLELYNDIMDGADQIPLEWHGDFEPTDAEIEISRARVHERMEAENASSS